MRVKLLRQTMMTRREGAGCLKGITLIGVGRLVRYGTAEAGSTVMPRPCATTWQIVC